MTDVDHSGLGASYLRSHSDTPIQHPAGASCAYCAPRTDPPTPDPLTDYLATEVDPATALADLRDAVEIMDQKITPYGERDEDGTTLAYIVSDSTWHRVLAVARGSTSDDARKAIAGYRAALSSAEPTLDVEMEWLDPRHRQWSRDNIARHPDARFPYKAILPLIDALDTLAARLRGRER